MFGTFKGMEVFWKRGWGGADTGQLHIKALFRCGTSVSVLLLDSGDSAYSQCRERDFFPWMIDRHPKEPQRGKAHIQSRCGLAL